MKRAASLLLLAVSAVALAACATTVPAPAPKLVQPFAETPPVGSGEDAADDPAIWVNPADPAVGERTLLQPRHIDPTINLHPTLWLQDGAEIRAAAVDGRMERR